VDGFRFLKSYALWCSSVLVMFLGFRLDPKLVQGIGWRFILLVVLLPGIFQYISANFFGSWIGFTVMAPFIDGRLFLFKEMIGENVVRAVGTYYEPSMLGRVLATLCAIILMTEGRARVPAAGGSVAIVVSRSFAGLSLLLMTFATYLFNFSRKGLLGSTLLIVFAFSFWGFIEERASGAFDASDNSTYVRLILPLRAISQLLSEYPFGAPFGSNSLVVKLTIAGTLLGFDEHKITSGIYEILLYTGIVGVLTVLYIFILAVGNIMKGHKEPALSQLFLLFGTVASSSLLSVESSLLTTLLILAARGAEESRVRRERLMPLPPNFSIPYPAAPSTMEKSQAST
jgi:hypothetical protein